MHPGRSGTLHRVRKAAARISTGGKAPRCKLASRASCSCSDTETMHPCVVSPDIRALSLSPTPTTSSVEAYIMSTDRIPLHKLPKVPCLPTPSSSPSVASTSSAARDAASHVCGPNCASTSSTGSHPGIHTTLDGPSSPFVRAFKDAANEHRGISDWEMNGLFEKCDHCSRWFSCLALRAHIATHVHQ
jgi:hypothetical protein